MYLNLEDLGLRGGQRHVCVYTVDIAPVLLGGARYDVVLADGVTAVVERVAGGYLVGVQLEAKAFGPCTRCLREVEVKIHAEQQEFVPTAAGGWEEAEVSLFIKDRVVDLSGLSREALVLAIPDRVLCSPACKGLCAQCGLDLNSGTCECSP
jgi:uncharacterized protein